MLVLFTDTDTDITPEIAKRYGYHLISMPYAVHGEEVLPYKDSDTFDFHAFYDLLRKGTMATTSTISMQNYIDYFEPHFAAGNDILYVHFSAAMTKTFDFMHMALDRLHEKYPERKFYEVDTKGITVISLSIVMEVGDMILGGKSVEEVLKWAETEVDHTTIYFMADDLKFFKRSGRVSGISATMGDLLGIRPIIYMNEEGKMVSCGKVRGRMKTLNRLMQYMDELGDHVADHRIFIGHTDAPELASEMEKLIRAKYGDEIDLMTVPTNPTAGAHCGPNGVGVVFHCKHR